MWADLTFPAFVILALLHLMPALAAVRPRWITALYGAAPDNPAFALLQHRAALFGAVVAVCAWAVFDARVRPAAAITAAISMLSFLWIYAASGRPARLRSIALADLVCLPALAVALWPAVRPEASA